MLNYRKIRSELLKRYEKDVPVTFYRAQGARYIDIYPGVIVRLPDEQDPFRLSWQQETENMPQLWEDLAGKVRAKPVNRMVAGPDDLYHMVRADDKSLTVWYPQTLFGLLDAKEDYDWHVDKESRVLWVTSEPANDVEIICAPGYVEDADGSEESV